MPQSRIRPYAWRRGSLLCFLRLVNVLDRRSGRSTSLSPVTPLSQVRIGFWPAIAQAKKKSGIRHGLIPAVGDGKGAAPDLAWPRQSHLATGTAAQNTCRGAAQSGSLLRHVRLDSTPPLSHTDTQSSWVGTFTIIHSFVPPCGSSDTAPARALLMYCADFSCGLLIKSSTAPSPEPGRHSGADERLYEVIIPEIKDDILRPRWPSVVTASNVRSSGKGARILRAASRAYHSG